MSYQSPIDIIMHDMQMKTEDETCKAVQKVGVYVDKDELIRALQYDRKQYEKGYADRDAEIVRCKDCKHGIYSSEHGVFCSKATYFDKYKDANWFCDDGERRNDSD